MSDEPKKQMLKSETERLREHQAPNLNELAEEVEQKFSLQLGDLYREMRDWVIDQTPRYPVRQVNQEMVHLLLMEVLIVKMSKWLKLIQVSKSHEEEWCREGAIKIKGFISRAFESQTE